MRKANLRPFFRGINKIGGLAFFLNINFNNKTMRLQNMLLAQYHQLRGRPQYITAHPIVIFASFLHTDSLEFLAFLHDTDLQPVSEIFTVFLPISKKQSLNQIFLARVHDAFEMPREMRTIMLGGIVNDAMRLVSMAQISLLQLKNRYLENKALFGTLAAQYLQKFILLPAIYFDAQTYFLGIPLFQNIPQFCQEVFFLGLYPLMSLNYDPIKQKC
jgi:hypothetical protein